jgi:hypothetical protein
MKKLTLILVAASAFAANEMESPSLGWIWDAPTKSIRRLVGLPGSVRNESGITLPEETLAAWASPDALQIVVALPDSRLERRYLNSEESLQISADKPDEVLFSPDGRLAALWWKSANRFALWGDAPAELSAKSIQLLNDGETLILEADGLLRSSSGSWIGNFGPESAFRVSGQRLVVSTPRAFILFDRNGKDWRESARYEFESIPSVRQIEIESPDSLLTVGLEGQLTRWLPASGTSELLTASGVERLRPLRQAGFYLAEGETPQMLFALSQSQRLYAVPAPEVR